MRATFVLLGGAGVLFTLDVLSTFRHSQDIDVLRVKVYQLYPTPEQTTQMARIAGACQPPRSFITWCHLLHETARASPDRSTSLYNVALKQRRNWWRPGRCLSFAQQCRELHRTGRKSGMVRIPKVGRVRLRGWTAIPGETRSLTVSHRAGVWSASIQWRRKSVAKVIRGHARVANIRHDWMHKQTTAIIETQGLVAVESLRLRSMSASAKGTAEQPGRRVRQKANLNRSVLDGGLLAFLKTLVSKLADCGGHLVTVDPAYPSQTCLACGAINRNSMRSRDLFVCTACDHAEHAGINAAKTILRRCTPSMPVLAHGCAAGEAGTSRRAA